jgi:integrase
MPQTEHVNFTERFVMNVKPPTIGRAVYWDSSSRGLGVTVQATGTKTFFWARRVNKRLIWHTIGSADDFTLPSARQRADEINSQVGKWREAGCVGPVPVERARQAVTLSELFDTYCVKQLARAKNPVKSIKDAKWFFDAYLTPLANREIASITRSELRELHGKLGEKNGPVGANRALQLAKAIINYGISSEVYEGGNVASKIDLFPEYSRERVAQKTELVRLFAELAQDREPSRDLRDFVWLALLTGARKSDVLSMKWSDLALADNRWTVAATTKTGRAYDVALAPRAIAILEERAARRKKGDECAWVFPSHGATGHLRDLKRAWKKLLERAQITNLRQHDLRRTLASMQLKKGAAMATVGKSLGHAAGSQATAIYARPDFSMVSEAVNAAASAMLALATKPTKNTQKI